MTRFLLLLLIILIFKNMEKGQPVWIQKTISLSKNRGCYIITKDVLNVIGNDIKQISIGTVNLFLQHTSAAITINESYDPDVMKDLNNTINKLVPENNGYIHTDEGPDDAPSHIKCAMIGPSLTIPIKDGSLLMGTWQGIILCEFRNSVKHRNIVATINGLAK